MWQQGGEEAIMPGLSKHFPPPCSRDSRIHLLKSYTLGQEAKTLAAVFQPNNDPQKPQDLGYVIQPPSLHVLICKEAMPGALAASQDRV